MESVNQTPPASSSSAVSEKFSARTKDIFKRVSGGEHILKQAPNAPVATGVEPRGTNAPSVIDTPEFDINPPQKTEIVPQKIESALKADNALRAHDALPEDFVPEDPSDEIDQLIDPKENIGLHLKKFRTKLKSVNKDLRSQREENETLKKKVTDYESGLAVPETLAQMQARIDQLETYEKLYNFKASPVYQQKFAQPLQEEHQKLKDLATEYDIDKESLNSVLSAGSAQETNRLLSQLFTDEVGALEAKSILRNIKKIQNEAGEAEKEPASALVRMQTENERIIQDRRAREHATIANVSKDAWVEALQHLRVDNRFPEITYREGDTEHNEKYVRPLLTKAGYEYGKMIKEIAQNGITKDVSRAIARMTQLSHQAAVVGLERDRLQKRVQELEGLLNSKVGITRPGVNSTSGGNSVSSNGTTKAVGAQNAGRRVLEKVLGKQA